MIDRRDFCVQTAALAACTISLRADDVRPRERLPVAAVVTQYRRDSHSDVILGKILEGYAQDGGAGPALRLASVYVDQFPANDLSRDLARRHDFRIARTVEDALTLGTDRVAVAGVLSIGEHGDYPYTEDTHQQMYPRRRFFDAIANVLRQKRTAIPIFNDKHLAYAWRDAKHMFDTARALNIPFLAGSSLPVAWRTPETTLPLGCVLTGALAIGYGGLEAYGFHSLEMLQCMVERRRGGETGVASVQAVRGDAIAQALTTRRWSRDLLDAAVATTPVRRGGRPAAMSPETVFFLIEYRDGLQAAVAMRTGLSDQFAFAGQIEGNARPVASWFRLHESRPYRHFEYLLRAIEETIHTRRAAYPVERTLLTTGILDAALHSLAQDGRRIATPELAIEYRSADWPFARGLPPE